MLVDCGWVDVTHFENISGAGQSFSAVEFYGIKFRATDPTDEVEYDYEVGFFGATETVFELRKIPTQPANAAPTASAGPDQTVASAAAVTLDGTASSDPDAGQTITYAWSQTEGDAVTLSDATAASPSFTAPTLNPGDTAVELIFQLIVTDNLGLASTADVVTITVEAPANQAPTASAGPDQTVASAAAVTLDGTASSDPDAGQTITYAWSQTEGDAVTLSDATAASPTFTAPTLNPGDPEVVLTFQLIVTDNLGLASTADVVTITVVSGVSVALSGGPDAITGTDPFTVTATFSTNVTGFDDLANDVDVTNGSVTDISGSGAVYTLTIAPTGNGDVSIFIPAAAAQEDRDDGFVNPNSASDTLRIGNRIVEITERAISSFMLGRANNLASNQPRLSRFLRGEGCGSFNASGNDAGGSLEGCATQGNVWTEITASWGNGSSYSLGTIGAHQFINENFLLGGMVQFDRATDDRNNARGTGWMVGPYFAAKMAEQPLYFEGRLLYGQTSNRISPLGTYTDGFSTERWLAQLRAEGEIQQETITWIPLLDFTHTRDRSRAYTDSLGNAIGSQSVALTQLTSGMDFRVPLQSDAGSLELTGGASAIYSSTRGGSADFENGRGRVHMGMNWDSGQGTTVRAGTFYDGIGSRFRSVGGNLGVDIRF
ncbi:PKD domain-containing protein [Roseinatronobacter monicus]|nr:Ig-like domain-containing protein [Roseinatronobacter monicus]